MQKKRIHEQIKSRMLTVVDNQSNQQWYTMTEGCDEGEGEDVLFDRCMAGWPTLISSSLPLPSHTFHLTISLFFQSFLHLFSFLQVACMLSVLLWSCFQIRMTLFASSNALSCASLCPASSSVPSPFYHSASSSILITISIPSSLAAPLPFSFLKPLFKYYIIPAFRRISYLLYRSKIDQKTCVENEFHQPTFAHSQDSCCPSMSNCCERKENIRYSNETICLK